MKFQKFLIICLLVVFLLGCKTQQGQSQQTSEQQQTSANDKPRSQGSSVSSELTQFLSNKANLQWKIAYDVATEAQGQSISMKMTQYYKGAKKIRTDMRTQGVESRTYIVNDELTVCSQTQDSWNCFKTQLQEDKIGDTEKDFQSNLGNYNAVADGSKTVAGTSAKCFKVTDKSNKISMRECFSGDGIPLYIYMAGQGFTTEMTAASFSKTVSDSDFEVPAGAQTSTMPSVPEDAGSDDPCAACNYLTGDQKDQCLASC